MTRAFVGIGSNLGDREATIRHALSELARVPGVQVVRVSMLRETDPVGITDQPRFLNGAAEIETTLDARGLLDALLAVERTLGRLRTGPRFGPRTIDLDLLVFGGEILDEPGLHVPHPRLHERRFALQPLADLDPRLEIPGRGTVATLLAGL